MTVEKHRTNLAAEESRLLAYHDGPLVHFESIAGSSDTLRQLAEGMARAYNAALQRHQEVSAEIQALERAYASGDDTEIIGHQIKVTSAFNHGTTSVLFDKLREERDLWLHSLATRGLSINQEVRELLEDILPGVAGMHCFDVPETTVKVSEEGSSLASKALWGVLGVAGYKLYESRKVAKAGRT